jgi:drug/metabolite transporter (DMT)-like permease
MGVTQSQRGTLYVFIAALLYSIGGLCIKVIPWNGMSINGGRTAIALVVIGAYLIWRRHPLKLNRWVVVGALSVFGCNALFSVANKMTTAANAIVLQFTAPIFVLLFSILLFGKRPTRLDLVTCLLVFGGILFFFLDSLEKGNNIGNVIALLSGIAYAGVFLMNELPGGDAISSVFWGDVLSAVTGLPFLLQETEFSATGVGSLIVLGVFQVGLAYILLTEGLKTTPAVTASLVSGIEPVLNPVLVAVFYREFIGAMSFVGAVVVVGSVIGYNVLLARQKSSV